MRSSAASEFNDYTGRRHDRENAVELANGAATEVEKIEAGVAHIVMVQQVKHFPG